MQQPCLFICTIQLLQSSSSFDQGSRVNGIDWLVVASMSRCKIRFMLKGCNVARSDSKTMHNHVLVLSRPVFVLLTYTVPRHYIIVDKSFGKELEIKNAYHDSSSDDSSRCNFQNVVLESSKKTLSDAKTTLYIYLCRANI